MSVSPAGEANEEIHACLGRLMTLMRAAGLSRYRVVGSNGLHTSTIMVETWDGEADFEFWENETSDPVLRDTAAFLMIPDPA